MKNLILFGMMLSISSCAGTQLKKEWKEQRHYSDPEIQAVQKQANIYQSWLNIAAVQSNQFNSQPYLSMQTRIRGIFCACVKRLQDRCQKPSRGLASADRDLWLKGNAAELSVVAGASQAQASSLALDPMECQ